MIIGMVRVMMITGLPILAACQNSGPSKEIKLTSSTDPQKLMVNVARNAQKCWFKAKKPAFAAYRLANEVNSYSGMPRILLVPKSNPGGLPSLVIQASSKNSQTHLQAFGPFLSGNSGRRVSTDLANWNKGNNSCTL